MLITAVVASIASWLATTVAASVLILAALPIMIFISAFILPYKLERMRMHYAAKFKPSETDFTSEWQKDFDKDMEQPGDIAIRFMVTHTQIINRLLLAKNNNALEKAMKDQLKKTLKADSDTNFDYILFISSSISSMALVPLLLSILSAMTVLFMPLSSIRSSLQRGMSAATAVGNKLDTFITEPLAPVVDHDLPVQSNATPPIQKGEKTQNSELRSFTLHKSNSSESLTSLATEGQNLEQNSGMTIQRKNSLVA